jgi:hypothetical protein
MAERKKSTTNPQTHTKTLSEEGAGSFFFVLLIKQQQQHKYDGILLSFLPSFLLCCSLPS